MYKCFIEVIYLTIEVGKGGQEGLKPPPLPDLHSDYVHNNLLTEVVIVLICMH